jgi:hypothetical protein
VVESFPEWAVESLVAVVSKTAEPNLSSIYQISFWPTSLGFFVPENATELASFINDNADKIQTERLTTFQDHSEIIALRTQWQNRADQELLWEWTGYAVDFGILAVLLWILYRSVSSYVQGLRAFFSRTQPVRKLCKPLSVQVCLFLIACATGVLALYGKELFIRYLGSVVLLVWLFEIGMYAYLRSSHSHA